MNKCVNSACCCNACRSCCQKLCIKNRICRKNLITEYRQFIISTVICDNRKCCHLRTCSCCCRDRDQRNDRSRNFVGTFIFRNASAIFRSNTDCFCHIHRRTSSKCNDKICACFFECFCCLIHCLNRRISFYICKCINGNPCRFQRICCLLHKPHLRQMRSGHKKCM